METLIFQSKSKKSLKILTTMAKKIGVKTKVLKNKHLEDFGIANAMKKGRTGQYINNAEFLNKLRGK